jgi:hypothetical protein
MRCGFSPIRFWRGPKPGPVQAFSVSLVGDDRRWRVRADRVKEAHR